MKRAAPVLLMALVLASRLVAPARAGFRAVRHRSPAPGEVAVTGPGSFAEAGKTYVLTRDMSSPMTPVFLGKDVTLDLNGHTVAFADGSYAHVPNYGFEDGLKGWDVSKAPGARVVPSAVRPMVGQRILELKRGDEISSPYIELPVADRTYYAMCAVAVQEMRVTINVEDAEGRPVTCTFTGRREPVSEPPLVKQGPQLGGGVLFAHLHHLPAGRYRLRIKAETDCLVDECDIRPGLDAGVAVVGAVKPYATYSDALNWYPCAFLDYNRKDTQGEAVEGIPLVTGSGTVTIRNGVIRSGTLGMRTLGVQSNAGEVTVVLDNVRIVNAGINANAARLSRAKLRNCRFEVDTPFIIDRHNTTEMSVHCDYAAVIAGCEFIGGQGNFSGTCPDVHDNLFVNAQTVTNHYSISPGSGTKVYRNRFEPRIGSGIYIGRGHDVEVYQNTFRISSAPPNCEYRYSAYSTNAVRLSDYDAKPTDPEERRCAGNRVYNNTITVTGRSYPQYDGYEPRAYAFFISVGGGANEIRDNRIVVQKADRGNVLALAFMVGGSSNAGIIRNNQVDTNCPAAWIGTDYGSASNAVLIGNTFRKARGTPAGTEAFILGDGGNTATNLGFYANRLDGWKNVFAYHSETISYCVGHLLTVKVVGPGGRPRVGAKVEARAARGLAAAAVTDHRGAAVLPLAQAQWVNGRTAPCGRWTVRGLDAKADLEMTRNRKITLRVK